MYLFSDPLDPLHRYIDSWTPESGVTSYEGYVNEHFHDEAISCSIKWAPGHPSAGIYAKRDILLNEELFTGYGKPQWIYTLKFFSHILSPRTLQDATIRYNILSTDQLTPCLSSFISSPTSPGLLQKPAMPDTATDPTSHDSNPQPQPWTPTTPPQVPQEPPTSPTFPHGTHEGVAIAPSRMPSAGQGLYGIRPHPDSAHLFAKKGQFI
jgi:hypothetical protein